MLDIKLVILNHVQFTEWKCYPGGVDYKPKMLCHLTYIYVIR